MTKITLCNLTRTIDEHINERDIRLLNTLSVGTHLFKEAEGKKHKWEIMRVVGLGASCIVYECASSKDSSIRYCLKEYYPIHLAQYVSRDGDDLVFKNSSQIISEEWQSGKENFLNVKKIENKLPLSNSENGRYFIYSHEVFSANNTSYIVSETGNYKTLREYISKAHENIEQNPKDKNNNSYIKTVLKYFIDICDAVAILHEAGYLHLDISDNNIMIDESPNVALLNDLGSAMEYDKTEDRAVVTHSPSYSDFYSPIEQLTCSYGSHSVLGAATDTYAICAVLYRCLFNEFYDPTEGIEIPKYIDLVDAPKIPLCVDLGNDLTWELLKVLKDGLKGVEYRFQTVDELKKRLQYIARRIQTREKEKSIRRGIFWGIGIACLLIFLSIFGYFLGDYLDYPSPNVAFYSELTQDIYFNGETLTLYIAIRDDEVLLDSYEFDADELTNVETIGFTAESKHLISEWDAENHCVRYNISFENLNIVTDGEKKVVIKDIYRGKYNKTIQPFEFVFDGYVSEPVVKISAPSHTKVNSDEGHAVSYVVEFIGEETARVDFKKVYWNGFNAELKSEKLSDTKYLLNFTNISGPVGKCYITVPSSVFTFENGALSKQTTSQCFEIIEESVTNYPIEIYLHIKKQQFIENGYILLEYGSYSGQNHLDYFDESFIELYGFDADIALDPLSNSILLNNITINTQSNVVPEILIKEGAFVSKENGSISKMISVYPLDYKEVPDSSIPAITMYRITNSESVFDVERGDSLVLNIIAADNYSCLINSDISTSIVENGFSYDEREIIVNGLAIQIIYSNVQPIEISGKCGVAVLEGTYTDMNGNESHKKTWPFKIVE